MLREAIEVIRELHTGELVDYRGEFFQVDSARIWDLPEQPVEIGVAVGGDRAIEELAPLADHLIATEPDAELVTQWNVDRRRPEDRRRGPEPSARSRSAGTRTRRPRSSARTSSSAGSPAAGASTPTCRPRPASPGRRSSSDPRTSPTRSPADPTWTRSWRACVRSGRPGTPTSRSSRSVATPRSSSSTRSPSRCSRSCAPPRPGPRTVSRRGTGPWSPKANSSRSVISKVPGSWSEPRLPVGLAHDREAAALHRPVEGLGDDPRTHPGEPALVHLGLAEHVEPQRRPGGHGVLLRGGEVVELGSALAVEQLRPGQRFDLDATALQQLHHLLAARQLHHGAAGEVAEGEVAGQRRHALVAAERARGQGRPAAW